VTTQISPQMRIVALVGVLLIALAGASLVLLRHSAPSAASPPPATHHRAKPVTPVSQHHSPAPPPVRVKVVQPAVNPLLPGVLRAALARHLLVVAAFYDPQVKVDSLTVTEARAGAAGASSGFVAVNLLDDAVAGRLTALLPANELLPTPGILVYDRHGKVVYRFDGYLDRQAIAQAVKSSK
jgi:hypothetical protein